jgi:hypothetical protein
LLAADVLPLKSARSQAVQELAQYCGVQPVVVSGLAHDCMLDVRWEEAARQLRAWADAAAA